MSPPIFIWRKTDMMLCSRLWRGSSLVFRYWIGTTNPRVEDSVSFSQKLQKGVLPTKSAKHTLSKFRHKESRVFLR